MNLAEVEEFLTKKSWQFVEATPPNDDYMGQVLFGYEVTKDYKDNFAECFIWYYYGDDLKDNKISIQVLDIVLYETYLNKIKQYKCELIKSVVEDGSIVKYYKGKSITFKVTISNQKNSDDHKVVAYIFHISSNT